jgi:uncharacterized LabA/DUF88 family protein
MPAAAAKTATPTNKVRVRVFVDFWNFQLTINEMLEKKKGLTDPRFSIDWKKLGPWLAQKACETVGVQLGGFSYDGMNVYASYNPKAPDAKSFHNWITTWLDRQPGVDAICLERKPKSLPKCPVCHRQITHCPHTGCGKPLSAATIEKGVDTLIATDMIRLAWEGAYEIAVLASLDSDLVPAVQFLNLKGLKVVQAGFPPGGVDLATASWASFDVFPHLNEIERQTPTR